MVTISEQAISLFAWVVIHAVYTALVIYQNWQNLPYNRNIDDVDKTMDEINEQTENMKQIQEALAAPIGAAADFDEVINKPLYRFLTQTAFTHCSQGKKFCVLLQWCCQKAQPLP